MEDRYKLLNAPELAGEDAFIQWVIRGERDQEWSQWMASSPDRTEMIAEAKYIVQMMAGQPITTLNAKDKSQLWSSIRTDTNAGKKKRRTTQSIIFRLSIAAAAAIALLIWWNSASGVESIIVDPGQTADITLPESSMITVNAGSTVKYNKKTFVTDREIQMEGEAFFKVTPGSRFTVITSQGTVTVVGTSFNVISRPGRFEVSCYTGKVKVQQSETDKVELTSGQKCGAAAMKDQLELKTFDPSIITPDWTRGKFMFENQPLSIIAGEIERQYGVVIKLAPGVGEMRYSGPCEGDLEQALKLVTWPLHLKVQITGKTVTISQ